MAAIFCIMVDGLVFFFVQIDLAPYSVSKYHTSNKNENNRQVYLYFMVNRQILYKNKMAAITLKSGILSYFGFLIEHTEV